jgi:PPOX class probable F420-dependent enzyme
VHKPKTESSSRQVLGRKVRAFLEKPRVARLATAGRDGYPHVVTIWFMRDGDDIVFACERGDQKVQNALRNPKAAVVIGGDPKRDEAGYMIQGTLSVEDDPDHVIGRRMATRYLSQRRSEQFLAEYGSNGPVTLRLRPAKVIPVWW